MCYHIALLRVSLSLLSLDKFKDDLWLIVANRDAEYTRSRTSSTKASLGAVATASGHGYCERWWRENYLFPIG